MRWGGGGDVWSGGRGGEGDRTTVLFSLLPSSLHPCSVAAPLYPGTAPVEYVRPHIYYSTTRSLYKRQVPFPHVCPAPPFTKASWCTQCTWTITTKTNNNMTKMEKNFVSMENFTDFVYYDTGKINVFCCFLNE
jgi:hypothetical protein